MDGVLSRSMWGNYGQRIVLFDETTDVQFIRDAVPCQRRVLTYGTYDLLHYGHIRLLKRAAALGDSLLVGLSTDEFNAQKGKDAFYPYAERCEMLSAVRYVDYIFPETAWEQKRHDIITYGIDVVVMGSDWKGSPHFEELRDICEVVFLEYTFGISTTEVKKLLAEESVLRIPIG
jgi:glycerol-3-phosphate cytidylyltransferase